MLVNHPKKRLNILFASWLNPYGARQVGGAESSGRLLAKHLVANGHRVFYLTAHATAQQRALARDAGVELRAVPRLPGARFGIVRRLNWSLWTLTIAFLTQHQRLDLMYCFYNLEILESATRVRSWLKRPKIIMRMAGLLWYERSKNDASVRARYATLFSHADSVNFVSPGLVPLVDEKLSELRMRVRFRDTFTCDIGSSAPVKRTTNYASLPEQPFRILMVSRFSTYQKRQDLLIQATALIRRDLKVSLTLVGEGARLRELQDLAERLNVYDQLEFLPFQAQPALWQCMQHAHLMCHATDYEGLGKVIVEAMANGLPVLASDVPPLNDYIEEGANGFLVANTPEAWGRRIKELCLRRDDLARVSEASMGFAAEHWDAERNVSDYEGHLTRLIKD